MSGGKQTSLSSDSLQKTFEIIWTILCSFSPLPLHSNCSVLFMSAYQGRPTVILTGTHSPRLPFSFRSTFPSSSPRWFKRNRTRNSVRSPRSLPSLTPHWSLSTSSELLLQENINVLSISRSTPPELDALSSTYPGALIISKGDVSKDDDNKQAVEMCMQSFGRLDALIRTAFSFSSLASNSLVLNRNSLVQLTRVLYIHSVHIVI